jgi:hypothetical protein
MISSHTERTPDMSKVTSQSDSGTPCDACPWVSKEARDKSALTPAVRDAAVRGEWFCCHIHQGTCHGARRYGESKRRQTPMEPATSASV